MVTLAPKETSTQSLSLKSLYESVMRLYQEIQSVNLEGKDALISKALSSADEVTRIIGSEGMFSKNEEIDDISTYSLKYLLITYYRGRIVSLRNEERVKHLTEGRENLQLFLHSCIQKRIITGNDLEDIEIKDDSEV